MIGNAASFSADVGAGVGSCRSPSGNGRTAMSSQRMLEASALNGGKSWCRVTVPVDNHVVSSVSCAVGAWPRGQESRVGGAAVS